MRVLIAAALAALSFAVTPAQAQDMAKACADLAARANEARWANLPDAPTRILSATIVPAGGDKTIVDSDHPEICRVEGMIAPAVGFLLRMPTKSWNGKFLMSGCGGPCGYYQNDYADPALVRNYAVVATDMGHKGPGWSFGYNNTQGMIDFAYRATHLTANVAKELIAAYYGKPSARNYFSGCSTGGRQGLIEAQRFPLDFHGIIAGAPPQSQTGHQILIATWGQRANTGKDGKPILSEKKLPMIHKAVLEACDTLDNLKDGVLQNPPSCKWEPKQIQCKTDKGGDDCLTAAEVTVVEKIYQGATWEDSRPMYQGNSGRARGTELKWAGAAGELAAMRGDDDSMTKYFDIFAPRGPGFDDNTLEIDREVPRLNLTEWMFHQRNPDLREFKGAGGKFLLYAGWDDTCCRAFAAIDYYELVTRVMGGPEQTMDFMRLFLPSGMDHCRYGIGGGEADWLTALEQWVEQGKAPEQVIAYHMVEEPYPSIKRPPHDHGLGNIARTPRHPLPKESYDRAHPVYPYPDWPRYSGKGDPNDPNTWQKAPR